MQTHQDFFPHVLFPDDLTTMTHAVRDAIAQIHCVSIDPEDVARIAMRFYRLGLVDEAKLAEVTEIVARQIAGVAPS